MLEPTPPVTTDTEVECLLVSEPDFNATIIQERNKELQQIEEDLEHMSSAQKLLAKIVSEQGVEIDHSSDNISNASNLTEIANQSLLDGEKYANSIRKRNAIIGIIGGAVVAAVATITTLSVLKTQNKL